MAPDLPGVSEPTRMTELLVSIAEVSNLLTCLAVIFALALFVVRFAGDDLFADDGVGPKYVHVPPRVMLSKILLPFRIKLRGIKEPYRIELELTALCPGNIKVFWGVDINAFHQVLRAPEDWFTQAFFHGNLFGQGKCSEMGECQQINKVHEGQIVVQKPSDIPLQLGCAPRDIYPCVVVIASSDCALLSAIHIRDDQCTVPSQILAEYHKSGSTATLLHQIFVANSDLGENSDTESQEDSDTEEYSALGPAEGGRGRGGVARCVVCQQEKISRVILPCRHAASCHTCFSRLNHCPMCRGFIQSYFLMRREHQSGHSATSQDNEEDAPASAVNPDLEDREHGDEEEDRGRPLLRGLAARLVSWVRGRHNDL